MLGLKRYLRNEKGFTMIEMMVVLIIIAVLIGAGIKFYSGYIENAKITKAKAQISTMQSALDSWFAEKGSYPDTTNELKYAGVIPSDETTSDTDIGNDSDVDLPGLLDPWGQNYDYRTDADGTKYCISTGYDKVKGDKEVIGQGKDGNSDPPDLADSAALP
ncbi:hypothetical protein Desku_1982 [Desulfofundulus kuznetsovii DSM 6115]|uniref:Type II secretion system protein GspG C-terminal domain-containing protein n=1 Tax=Desulfofundulus kuznetsovii (strain DSM 6115 / VKM B-1805 / 17) TaxID=760568 RepID=A0AAU8PBY9_DESK7|nr:hypothetical protein Desku_1982 [Desulfofundulus kuznetsovii DSM 6115]